MPAACLRLLLGLLVVLGAAPAGAHTALVEARPSGSVVLGLSELTGRTPAASTEVNVLRLYVEQVASGRALLQTSGLAALVTAVGVLLGLRQDAVLRTAAPRASALALVALVLVAAAGAVWAWTRLGSWDALGAAATGGCSSARPLCSSASPS